MSDSSIEEDIISNISDSNDNPMTNLNNFPKPITGKGKFTNSLIQDEIMESIPRGINSSAANQVSIDSAINTTSLQGGSVIKGRFVKHKTNDSRPNFIISE